MNCKVAPILWLCALVCAIGCNDHPDVELSDQTLRVYPSPMRDRGFVRVNRSSADPAELLLFDPAGKIILTKTVQSGVYEYEIDVRDRSAGRYHVILKSSESTLTRILVKE